MKDEIYIVGYQWKRKVGSFGKVNPSPDETYCAWCNKSQTKILKEHIKEHDK